MVAGSTCYATPITAHDAGGSTWRERTSQRIATLLNRLLRRGDGIPPGNLEDEHSLTAHNLRTPLTSIRSFAEIMLDNPDLTPEQRAHYLAIVVRESERLERAIDAVLREDRAA